MKELVVGSGGREHAIVTSVAKSSRVDKIYCAPGNAGIGQLAECVNIGAMEFDKLADFAQENGIDLTVVGMDDPLVGGIIIDDISVVLKIIMNYSLKRLASNYPCIRIHRIEFKRATCTVISELIITIEFFTISKCEFSHLAGNSLNICQWSHVGSGLDCGIANFKILLNPP